MEINVKGIYTPGGIEDRNIVYLTVKSGSNTYDWEWYMPLNAGMDVGQFIDSQLSNIEADVAQKEAIWAGMVASGNVTTTITDPMTNQVETIPIQMESIVKATVPDYYALRRGAYPSLANQVGAVLNPDATPSIAEIQAKVLAVKALYPKPAWMSSDSK